LLLRIVWHRHRVILLVKYCRTVWLAHSESASAGEHAANAAAFAQPGRLNGILLLGLGVLGVEAQVPLFAKDIADGLIGQSRLPQHAQRVIYGLPLEIRVSLDSGDELVGLLLLFLRIVWHGHGFILLLPFAYQASGFSISLTNILRRIIWFLPPPQQENYGSTQWFRGGRAAPFAVPGKVSAVARDLGINENVLNRWKRQLKQETERPA
jgi:hypothetical protein